MSAKKQFTLANGCLNLNEWFDPVLNYISSKGKPLSSIYNVFCLINMIKIGYLTCILDIEPLTPLQTEFK